LVNGSASRRASVQAGLQQTGFVVLELYVGPKARERARRCWLRPSIDGFLRHLAEQRYSQGTLRLHALQLLAFGEIDLAMKRKALAACEVGAEEAPPPSWQGKPDILAWLESL
jgi:hypothetical protein